MLRVICFALVG